MRVVVTGGLGFVGYAVVKNLVAAGHEVAALTHSGRTSPVPAGASVLEIADIRDRGGLAAALKEHDAEGVCHLAALAQARTSFTEPLRYFDVNVNGTVSLLAAIAEVGRPIPVVFGSTGVVYGSGVEGKFSEADLPRPDNPYAASKLAAEQLLHYHALTGEIGVTTLRCLAIAGACDNIGDPDDTRILPKALRVAAGQAPHVLVNGDGSAVREFTHVLDVAEAYRLALEATELGASQLYNVGSGVGVSMADLIAGVVEQTGRPVPCRNQPPKPEPHTLMVDSSRVRAELGWSSPNSGIRQIIADAWRAIAV